jgi:hypothetical protein
MLEIEATQVGITAMSPVGCKAQRLRWSHPDAVAAEPEKRGAVRRTGNSSLDLYL